jgi:hypothetical protein
MKINVQQIVWSGGACPYQIEGVTDTGEYFYLRYRMGRLRAGVATTENEFWNKEFPYNIIDKLHGGEMEGFAAHDDLYPVVKDIISFPEGFQMSSEVNDLETQSFTVEEHNRQTLPPTTSPSSS